jgi:hypothetical protein
MSDGGTVQCRDCGFTTKYREDGCLDIKFIMDNPAPTDKQLACPCHKPKGK